MTNAQVNLITSYLYEINESLKRMEKHLGRVVPAPVISECTPVDDEGKQLTQEDPDSTATHRSPESLITGVTTASLGKD